MMYKGTFLFKVMMPTHVIKFILTHRQDTIHIRFAAGNVSSLEIC